MEKKSGRMGATSSCGHFDRLLALVTTLLGEGGCPWDRTQTPDTIKIHLMEEAYEVFDAIESGSMDEVCGELGDLLFHIVFLARLYEGMGGFSIQDVVRGINEKMTRRHPHVFDEARISSVDEVKAQWHEIKEAEAPKPDRSRTSLDDTVPRQLPALMRAYRLGERASRVGIDGSEPPDVVTMVEEKMEAFKEAMTREKPGEAERGYGDLLFAVANMGRFIGIHPESALSKAVSRFVRRFAFVEEALRQQGRAIGSASKEEIQGLWEVWKTDMEIKGEQEVS